MSHTTQRGRPAHGARPAATHPQSVPILDRDDDLEPGADAYLAEVRDGAVDPDLRDRLIRETAYRYFAERGYADGFDMDDWLQAEAEVGQHVARAPARGGDSTED